MLFNERKRTRHSQILFRIKVNWGFPRKEKFCVVQYSSFLHVPFLPIMSFLWNRLTVNTFLSDKERKLLFSKFPII